ncbi:alpha/beta hydrolase [Flavobacterium gelidilacus]|uniref:alpha/beta hydrolase n=1 Tax=Flavobacterium gelidilacus TaxID=206041 RepID=UPI000424C280|nr:alpha/beta hydrolase [Flavobacterium gelidilacus]
MVEESALEKIYNNYDPDVLGDGFQKLTLILSDDYEGKVTANLIRRKSENESEKAILYIHGFNDYFFQEEMAKKFNEEGFNFYALDLRKYGRSYLSHQKLNNVRSLLEYDEEIDLALQIIKLEKNHQVIIKGHSTGGLILTNYAVNHLNSNLFHGLICNSPFYEFNLNFLERQIGIPLLSFLGNYFPNIKISAGFSEYYGHSLHIGKQGEWNYSLVWKPHNIPKVNLGFIRSIHIAQKNIRQHTIIDVPVLVMHSDKSIDEKEWSENYKKADAVLDVHQIKKYANKLTGNVMVIEIEKGLHDLVLSKKPVREKVYKEMFDWIKKKIIK